MLVGADRAVLWRDVVQFFDSAKVAALLVRLLSHSLLHMPDDLNRAAANETIVPGGTEPARLRENSGDLASVVP